MTIRKWGWVPDRADWRDHTYAVAAPTHVDHVDRIGLGMPIYDQFQLGGCTGNSVGWAVAWVIGYLAQGIDLSRLMAYFLGHVPEATQDVDAGAMIADVIKGVAKYGLSKETLWPYDIAKFAQRPSLDAFADAKDLPSKIKAYQRVPTLQALKNALVAGLPVVFGFSVPESFESPDVERTGWVGMPSPMERMIGGHAVVAVGFDDRPQSTKDSPPVPYVWVRNSWSDQWGISGYFRMDQRWFTDPRRLTDDAWAILPA